MATDSFTATWQGLLTPCRNSARISLLRFIFASIRMAEVVEVVASVRLVHSPGNLRMLELRLLGTQLAHWERFPWTALHPQRTSATRATHSLHQGFLTMMSVLRFTPENAMGGQTI